VGTKPRTPKLGRKQFSRIVAPKPVEPADSEVRTFADIENGDPDTVFDEIALDAAII
jgi:hypothetical protein